MSLKPWILQLFLSLHPLEHFTPTTRSQEARKVPSSYLSEVWVNNELKSSLTAAFIVGKSPGEWFLEDLLYQLRLEIELSYITRSSRSWFLNAITSLEIYNIYHIIFSVLELAISLYCCAYLFQNPFSLIAEFMLNWIVMKYFIKRRVVFVAFTNRQLNRMLKQNISQILSRLRKMKTRLLF